jgi:hypothetical protein
MFNSGENDTIQVSCFVGGPSSTSGASGWFDALKLEASTVVTAWTPGFVGKGVTMDAGGIMVDASPEGGATFRLQGSAGGGRDRIELGVNGLKFGGDIEMYSPSAGRITIKDNSPNNAEFAVGDDTTFFDADIADFLGIKSTSTAANGGFVFGVDKDTNLYRSAANQLKTDDSLWVVGNLSVSGDISIAGNARRSGEAWTAVTFTNSWADYGSTYAPAAYRKDAQGYVHLRGLIKSGTLGSAAFTLPAGFRPGYTNIYMGRGNVVSAASYTASDLDKNNGRVDINTGGSVIPHASLCNNGYVSLENITFLAEN